MSRAALNQQLFNQAVSLGLSPNFTGKGGKGRYTNYLQNLIASYRPPTPQAPPPPPPPPAPPQAPVNLTTERSRLQVGSSASRRRRASQPRAKRQLSLGLSSGASTGGTGGITF